MSDTARGRPATSPNGVPVDPYGLDPRQHRLQESARRVARSQAVGQASWERQREFPWAAARAMGTEGLLGLTHPVEVGGDAATRLDGMLALEQVARESFTLAEAMQIASNGPPYVLSVMGTTEIRDRYVPPVLRGDALISIAITEAQAGSSLGDTTTTARYVDDDTVVVSGEKCFVTAGPLASAHLVMARFGGEGLRGLGYVLVPASAPGCRVVRTWDKLGGNAIPEAVIAFDEVEVSADHVIISGDPATADGFRQAMTTYNAMRLGIAAICCGVAARALDLMVERMQVRNQAGRPLAAFQGLRWRLAETAADLESARLLTYRAARMVDEQGFPPAREAALAKLAAGRVAVRAADEAIQLLGWRGIVSDEDHWAEQMFREVRGWTIAGGTTESLLNLIASDTLRTREVRQ